MNPTFIKRSYYTMLPKVKIEEFVSYIVEQSVNKAGYIMGTQGEVLTPALLERFARYQSDFSVENYINLGKKWLGRRCYDCNGLAEGCYRDKTGININSKARFNFAEWCAGANGTDMSKMPQEPGVAVFINSTSKGYITHVGYLWRFRDGDWDVIEARGVSYGVVVTRYKARGWNRWGKMIKFYDYEKPIEVKPPIAESKITLYKKGSKGIEVEKIQNLLTKKGYSLGKIDGDFGPKTEAAVILFQKDNDLKQDGIVGPATIKLLEQAIKYIDLKAGINNDSERVKTIQQALIDKGYKLPKWGVDGDFGKETKAAVNEFQKAIGVKVTGVVDQDIWEKLLK